MPGNTENTCLHKHKRLIAQDKDAQYFECLDCGKILEAGEMPPEDASGYNESLSDA